MTCLYFLENCILMHPPQNPADALLTEVVTGRMVLLTDSGTVGSSIFTRSPWYISSGFLTSLYCHAWCLQNNQANFYTETSKPCRCMYIVVWHLLKYQIESTHILWILQNKNLFHISELVWLFSINQRREAVIYSFEMLNIYESQFWSCQEGT